MTEGEQGSDGKFPNQPPEQEAVSSQAWETQEQRLPILPTKPRVPEAQGPPQGLSPEGPECVDFRLTALSA